MPYTITEFQRPDPSVEYEEIEPVIVKPGDPIVIVDPNDPPIGPKSVSCCKCSETIGGCSPERVDGTQATTQNGISLSFIWN